MSHLFKLIKKQAQISRHEILIKKMELRTEINKSTIIDEKISKTLIEAINIIHPNEEYKTKKRFSKKILNQDREALSKIEKKINLIKEEKIKELVNVFENISMKINNTKNILGTKERFLEVKELFIYDNKNLVELPERIKKCKNLEYLSIGNAPRLNSMPTWIKDLPITKLDLLMTNIEHFPEEILKLELKKLDIRGSNFKIPKNESNLYYIKNFLSEIKKNGKLMVGEITTKTSKGS